MIDQKVDYLSVGWVSNLLWSHEENGSNLVVDSKFLGRLELGTQAEINNDDGFRGYLFIPEHNIFRLQISVNDVKFMNLDEALNNSFE